MNHANIVLTAALAGVLLAGCGVESEPTDDLDGQPLVIRGTAVLPDQASLPDAGALELSLVNTLLADTPTAVVARHTVENPTASPIPFELSVSPILVEENMQYSLSASLTDGNDRVWFITDAAHLIDPEAADAVRLQLIAVAGDSAGDAVAEGPVEGPVRARYLCAGRVIDTVYESGQVTLEIEGEDEPLVLPTAISASGARFAIDGNEFWSRGREATLILAGADSVTCQEQEPTADADADPADSADADDDAEQDDTAG